MVKRFCVAIDARLPDSSVGGVQQVISTQAIGFRDIHETSIRRIWLVYKGTKWWKDYLPSEDQIIEMKSPLGKSGMRLSLMFPNLVSRVIPFMKSLGSSSTKRADKMLRKLGVDLVHQPFQDAIRTSLPSIFHPHDLQHLYYPHFFSKAQLRHRETNWRSAAKVASVVIAETELVKEDLILQWKIDAKKIVIVPTPPLRRSPKMKDNVVSEPYILYPAAFWPHKNHENLIAAVALLKEKGIYVQLVLTGSKIGKYGEIVNLVKALEIEPLVSIYGHVEDKRFETILDGALAVIIPTLFESLSLPVWDAQIRGIPVGCSNIGSLPLQVGNSALLFDPLSPLDIAGVLEELWTNSLSRDYLSRRGIERTQFLNCTTFALAITGLYKVELGLQKTDQEHLALKQLQESVNN